MTAHHYVIRRPGAWAEVVALSKAHAWRLWLEGVEAVRGVDHQLERCGIVRERGVWRW